MTSLAIADVPWISKRIKACCRRAKLFSTDEILLSPPQQLQQALRISSADLDLLFLQIATAAAPPPVSVLDALNGKLPNQLHQSLFDTDRNDADSPQDSDASDEDDQAESNRFNDARLPSASFVPPTQGYDGNFPGAERFVYDSDQDSDSDIGAQSDHMIHDDVEMPSTFRTRAIDQQPVLQDQEEQGSDADHVAVPAITRDVLVLGRDRHVLTTGSQQLDELLAGGFRSAALTEIVGESGSGKTQTAIQACTYAALGFAPLPDAEDLNPISLPPPNGEIPDDATLRDILQGCGMAPWSDPMSFRNGVGACYITSGGERGAHSVVNRALELADRAIRDRFERACPLSQVEGSQDPLDREIMLAKALELGREQVLRNLHVACVADVEALEHALKYSLPGLISRLAKSSYKQLSRSRQGLGPTAEIGIVVVDNLPSLFQEDPVAGDIDSLVQRSKMLVEIAEALKRLAAVQHQGPRYDEIASSGRAVLILNHVSDAFGIDKEIARRFVFDSADRVRLHRLQRQGGGPVSGQLPESVYPDHPAAMDYATQSAFVSGLLASVPPTLAEAIGARADVGGSSNKDGPLYVLNPKIAQLGQTWTNLINVRLFLSKTRGRVAMPQDDIRSTQEAADSSNAGATGARSVMTTVRKTAVVLNPFGPTMLDPFEGRRRAAATRANRQMRFVITRAKAVHALTPSSLGKASSNIGPCAAVASVAPAAESPTTMLASQNVASSSQAETAGDEEEDFFGQFDLLEDHHLLAMDQFQDSLPNTPVS
ncbi:hypothetical protein NDA16_002265 [Ustilago loliicola]|nr:hypothetical protein NDA16_002265 [Ustilago loliicola]